MPPSVSEGEILRRSRKKRSAFGPVLGILIPSRILKVLRPSAREQGWHQKEGGENSARRYAFALQNNSGRSGGPKRLDIGDEASIDA